MQAMPLCALWSVMISLTACGAAVSSRPCPRVTVFPPALVQASAEELATRDVPATREIIRAVRIDRAFNVAICPEAGP